MSNLINQPIAWAHHATFNNLDNFDKSRFTATLSKKETNACCIPLFTNIQRTWIGLTDEEIDIAWRSVDYTVPYSQFRIDVAQAIEAKLKEKNI